MEELNRSSLQRCAGCLQDLPESKFWRTQWVKARRGHGRCVPCADPVGHRRRLEEKAREAARLAKMLAEEKAEDAAASFKAGQWEALTNAFGRRSDWEFIAFSIEHGECDRRRWGPDEED